LLARNDGIYLLRTNQRVIEGYAIGNYEWAYSGQYFSVRGWMYDNSAALYSKIVNPCLLEFTFADGATCFISVPQPLLKLRVPEEYLSLKPVP
jgi:hypothetical protein